MGRVRRFFEQLQQQQFHLDNLHQELDPFGTSCINNRSQLLTARSYEDEKILDTSEQSQEALHQSAPENDQKSEPEPEPEPVNEPEPLAEPEDQEAEQEIYGRRKGSDVSEMPESTVIVEAKMEPAARVRMFFELSQHFLLKHLDNLRQVLDPFGASPIRLNTAINISQIQTAEINQGEKKPDAALPVSSVLDTSPISSGNIDEKSQEMMHQSAPENERKSEPESVPEPEEASEPEPEPMDESEPEPKPVLVQEPDKKIINRRRKSSDVSEMPKNTAIVEAERDTNIPTSVQLFSSHSGHTIEEIEMKFTELLTNRLKHVSFVTCRKLENINSEEILIVLCIITSRVETDATYAIKNINAPTKTLLMLIHEKKSHALPRLRSSYVLTDQKFRTLGGVFDLAFLSGSGLYKCEMNDHSLNEICTFINKNRMKTN